MVTTSFLPENKASEVWVALKMPGGKLPPVNLLPMAYGEAHSIHQCDWDGARSENTNFSHVWSILFEFDSFAFRTLTDTHFRDDKQQQSPLISTVSWTGNRYLRFQSISNCILFINSVFKVPNEKLLRPGIDAAQWHNAVVSRGPCFQYVSSCLRCIWCIFLLQYIAAFDIMAIYLYKFDGVLHASVISTIRMEWSWILLHMRAKVSNNTMKAEKITLVLLRRIANTCRWVNRLPQWPRITASDFSTHCEPMSGKIWMRNEVRCERLSRHGLEICRASGVANCKPTIVSPSKAQEHGMHPNAIHTSGVFLLTTLNEIPGFIQKI